MAPTNPPFSRGIKCPPDSSRILSPQSTIFPTLRPGRIRAATPQDTLHRTAFGDTIYHKDEMHTRILFQNVKGLTPSTSCEDFKYCLDSLSSLQTDIVGLSETNVPWIQSTHHQADFRTCLRRQFNIGKVVFGSPETQVDPIAPNDNFQAGGSLMFTVGALVPMLSGSSTTPLHDPTGMGRWCGGRSR